MRKIVQVKLSSTHLEAHPLAAEFYAIWTSRRTLVATNRIRSEAAIAALKVRTLFALSRPEATTDYRVFAGFEALELCALLKARGLEATVTVFAYSELADQDIREIVAQEMMALTLVATPGAPNTTWIPAVLKILGREAARLLADKDRFTGADFDHLISRNKRLRQKPRLRTFGPDQSPTMIKAILSSLEKYRRRSYLPPMRRERDDDD